MPIHATRSAGGYHASLIVVTLALCLAGRAVNIFGLGFLLNHVKPARRDPTGGDGRERGVRVPMKYQAVMFHAGLRGAIAFAVAWKFPDRYGHREAVVGTTTMVVLITVFGMGGTTTPVLRKLGIETGVEDTGGVGAARARDAASKNALLRVLKRFDRVLTPIVQVEEAREDDATLLAEGARSGSVPLSGGFASDATSEADGAFVGGGATAAQDIKLELTARAPVTEPIDPLGRPRPPSPDVDNPASEDL